MAAAADWDIDSEFASAFAVKIKSHRCDRSNYTVTLWVEWQVTQNGPRRATRFDEVYVQDHRPEDLYDYWKALGGRCDTLGVNKYHVYEILGEEGGTYTVHWVGYSTKETSPESKAKIRRICPAAVRDWQRGTKQVARAA